jgi:hypothetical protein
MALEARRSRITVLLSAGFVHGVCLGVDSESERGIG